MHYSLKITKTFNASNVLCMITHLLSVVWLPWTQWSQCGATCGQGKRLRARRCDTGNNQDCSGDSLERIDCVLPTCPPRKLSA